MELRHSAKIEFNSIISVDEKTVLLNQIKTEFGLKYVDIVSLNDSTSIVGKFTNVKKVGELGLEVDMKDGGQIEFYDHYMYIKMRYDFETLVAIQNFIVATLGANVRDILIYHNENPNGTPSA